MSSKIFALLGSKGVSSEPKLENMLFDQGVPIVGGKQRSEKK